MLEASILQVLQLHAELQHVAEGLHQHAATLDVRKYLKAQVAASFLETRHQVLDGQQVEELHQTLKKRREMNYGGECKNVAFT